MTKPIPDGFHSVTPHLIVSDVSKAIDWYVRAFGAEETVRMEAPGGGMVLHAEVRIGDSPVMLGPESAEWGTKGPTTLGGTPVTVHLYVNDVDAMYKKAVSAGAKPAQPVEDAFWGDRYGKLIDPFGHHWSIATHTRDVSPEEMKKAMMEMSSHQKNG